MTILINGKSEEIDRDDMTINMLLKVNKVPDPEMVSVQLNGEILERNNYAHSTVKEGDEVEFIYFMGGG